MSEPEPPSSLAIVTAYVLNNQIAMADVAGLITAVAGRLSRVGAEPEQPAEEKPEAAVSVRRSVRPDHFVSCPL